MTDVTQTTPTTAGDPDTALYTALRDALLAEGLLIPTGVPGVYGKGYIFEDVLHRVNQAVSEAGRDEQAEVVWFPPMISREQMARSGYLKSFPHLAGTVHSFAGTERDQVALLAEVAQGADWAHHFTATDLALTPAACYPVYSLAAGTLPPSGRTFDVQSYCFRHEPSADPARMQVFRMHEYVRLGSPTQVSAFRDRWLERSLTVLHALELEAQSVVAHDPFFGRGGQLLAEAQREQSLKFELVVPISSAERPTAVVSCNYHQDHFGANFGITTHDGACAHSACVGFGLERITLALFKTHGMHPAAWPSGIRRHLGW